MYRQHRQVPRRSVLDHHDLRRLIHVWLYRCQQLSAAVHSWVQGDRPVQHAARLMSLVVTGTAPSHFFPRNIHAPQQVVYLMHAQRFVSSLPCRIHFWIARLCSRTLRSVRNVDPESLDTWDPNSVQTSRAMMSQLSVCIVLNLVCAMFLPLQEQLEEFHMRS